ncbi:STAS domain-containing protein [Myxococcus sp. CA051A]|uniref:STAS domain-containing protein n=1 Tax=Myxococcus llanfairpwllgwyngyllgogerychwyrndrobwllllantysiliogogogochensis TaxID=2590453 RepID=A0A540X2F1_9BACT|nr:MULTISPECIES: STAS domain-containing protein [Myxococcus]NTX03941.1 STAS domain-containing protein [Myxococcus sp. CA040A]NTX13447.1 STAS domain-containing protein [Myxococcus sp. CA056]NTX35693.1 STAS domain-containing protein [Myxococcus sp. CA033]NTX53772.1 STAS domain-containing protein [Myxococcus sp. CA039A]NTX61905.1 STAS domain-containing protein [Myxococcus sp. CA051A]
MSTALPTPLTVDPERVGRIIDVLSLISVGEFSPERTTISIREQDELAALEETLNVFVRELATTRREHEEALTRLAASHRELEEKLSTIDRQRDAIRDLSTPIIELWEDILTLPIVGVVDTQRSVEMTERLLQRVVQGKARCVIIDITGVEVVDTMTANHFIKMVNAARLLGAYCVVTGISPLIAQTLVQIGVDLREVKTLGSLKEGLRDCFQHLAGRGGNTSTSRR